MVVARIAWNKLARDERDKATAILKAHPHYAEFLEAELPQGGNVDEWVFMRAAYWPDWVRNHHADEFNSPTWHYVTQYFIPLYSKVERLPGEEPNVVTQISKSITGLKADSDAEKAIALCWVMHLIGDIHQPLHCCSLLSETFPTGDKGGNMSMVRIDNGEPGKLHPMWDGLLGKATAPSSINSEVAEIDKLAIDPFEVTTAPATWSEEHFALAVKYAYLSGDLRPANSDDKPPTDAVPNVAEAYAKDAGSLARVQVAKAGARLAEAIARGLP
jgi:hypothetical protein